MFKFIRIPFRGRKKYEAERAKHEAIARADWAISLLSNPGFEDGFSCELDILVDAMIEIEPDTPDMVDKLLRIHARIRELNNVISHLRAFAKQKEVIAVLDEKAA